MTHILLVDDDPGIQSIYGKFLKDEGYEVYQAQDAREATWFLIRQPIDLVLLDINMPIVDGTIMREIVEEYDKKLKVIVSSVYPLSEQRKKITNAHGYFDKSQGVERLIQIIQKVLDDSEKETKKIKTEPLNF